MPIEYTIDHDKRLVQARVVGVIALKDIEAFTDAVVAQNALTYRMQPSRSGGLSRWYPGPPMAQSSPSATSILASSPGRRRFSALPRKA